MKILKYVLYAILALIVLYLLLGFIKPEVGYGAEIVVDKPVEEAWAVSQDETKYPEWLEGFKSMELLSGEKFQEGSTYKIIVNPGDGQQDFEMIETLKSIKENVSIEMEFDADGMNFYQTMSFNEADGKTTIKTDSKVVGKGMMMRSMFAMMEMFGGGFTKQEVKNMEALKKLINENTTDYFPEPEVADSTIMEAIMEEAAEQ